MFIQKVKKMVTSKAFLSFFSVIAFSLLLSVSASANGTAFNPNSAPTDPAIVSGGVNLINKITGWMLIFIPASSIGLFMYQSWMKGMAEEGGEVASRTKAMKRIILWGPIAFGADGIIKVFFYYMVNK